MVKELSKQGYTLKDCCNAVGLSRSRYYSFNRTKENKQAQRIGEVQLCSRIKAIKTEHPFWGYRRVTAWLRHREGIIVNHKAVRKMQCLELNKYLHPTIIRRETLILKE